MLIEFSVKNYRSIKDTQTLSLLKANGSELPENSFATELKHGKQLDLLCSTVLYGANAAGKSNLVRAMMTMDKLVRESATSYQEGEKLPVEAFLFDDLSATKPTEFEVTFIQDGVQYQYGFAITKKYVAEEWLIAYPKGRPQNWFARQYDPASDKTAYKFGEHLTGDKAMWQRLTRKNALYLSTAIQLNAEALRPVFDWFEKKLWFIDNLRGSVPPWAAPRCEENEGKQQVLAFLRAAGLDFADIQIDRKTFDPDSLPDDMPEDVRSRIIEDLTDKHIIEEIRMFHKLNDGRTVALDLKQESDGTQRLFAFVAPWLDALEQGAVLVVDELHNSLHPKLVKHLIRLFHSKITNKHNAQLIFTTHETSVLNQDIFRRDQIWFCEKDHEQATILYPLTDFRSRKDRENLEARYLSGRYGAVPFIAELNPEMVG